MGRFLIEESTFFYRLIVIPDQSINPNKLLAAGSTGWI